MKKSKKRKTKSVKSKKFTNKQKRSAADELADIRKIIAEETVNSI